MTELVCPILYYLIKLFLFPTLCTHSLLCVRAGRTMYQLLVTHVNERRLVPVTRSGLRSWHLWFVMPAITTNGFLVTATELNVGPSVSSPGPKEVPTVLKTSYRLVRVVGEVSEGLLSEAGPVCLVLDAGSCV